MFMQSHWRGKVVTFLNTNEFLDKKKCAQKTFHKFKCLSLLSLIALVKPNLKKYILYALSNIATYVLLDLYSDSRLERDM